MHEAKQLFLEKGVKGTTVDEIIENSATGKGQFYYYFKNKENLISEVIDHYGCEVLAAHLQSLAQVKNIVHFMEWIQKAFDLAILKKERVGGCLLGVVMNETTSEQKDKLRKQLINLLQEWRSLINERFDFFKEQGYLIQETPNLELADFLITIFEGAALFGKVYQNTHHLQVGLHHYCLYLASYISPKYRVNITV
ncbi:TetR/AcrR family transcriptional regulator [Candidatus Uabimicrobium sp. HlEnr_7]|uniref:TetR/AcrR family transcriptional regulator n=1 Tax=Candidatus Uabimicrobium helgolandensis TaxID=3095367 RepID=UPI0035579674